MGSSIALTELTMQKYQRMQTCADGQRRSGWRPPYALTTALELLSIEAPRILSKHRGLATATSVAVPHANAKRHVVGVKVVVWPFPLDTVMVEGQFTCTSPACTWAMFSAYLELEELVVLADSAMRRDRRLCRTTPDNLSLYLDTARPKCAPIRRAAPIRTCSADMKNAAGLRFWHAPAQTLPWKHEPAWLS